jgi:hypothetical protein
MHYQPPSIPLAIRQHKQSTKHSPLEVSTMAQKQAKVIKKSGRRTPTAKLIDVRSTLAKQMLHLVVQFDLAYYHLKANLKEVNGIQEEKGLELMDNARKAVKSFSDFIEEFSDKAGFDYCPPKRKE